MAASSQLPNTQSSLSARRVVLDPIHGLPGQASLLGDLSDAHGRLAQHGADLLELFAREVGLTLEVSALVIPLCVLDASPLCGLGGLSLCLSGRGHEGISGHELPVAVCVSR